MSEEVTNTEENGTEAEAAPKVDKRTKFITTPDGDRVSRTDYIRKLWAEDRMDRSPIRDHINNDCTSDNGEHQIAYQIVFAATKEIDGGPTPEEKEAAKAEKKAAREAEKAAKKAEEAEAKAAAKAEAEQNEEGESEG